MVVFAPSPILTVTVEENPGGPEVHVHAGGQGVWQARMLHGLGIQVTICCALIGETGAVVGHLLTDYGMGVECVRVDDGLGAVYIHDRRGGRRVPLIETAGYPLTRHDLDALYSKTLGASIDADYASLSGPVGRDVLPDDVYRRLASDLQASGTQVVADLAGGRMRGCLEAGVRLAKMSDEEMLADGLIASRSLQELQRAMAAIVSRQAGQGGARTMIVTRAARPALLLDRGRFYTVTAPTMQAVDERGAGDSLTAGVTAALAKGRSMLDAVRVGVAAGAMNVIRHGLGSGDAQAIRRLSEKVTVTQLKR